MSAVSARELPPAALLGRYLGTGAYTDCFTAEIEGSCDLADYVDAFYTTRLFKLERLILQWLVARPSRDDEPRRVVAGALDRFAAWSVEDRAPNQLLMCDFNGRTRSWFMIEAVSQRRTRLYFGSAVTPRRGSRDGEQSLGGVFTALLGFHRVYSRILLAAAKSRLERRAVTRQAKTG